MKIEHWRTDDRDNWIVIESSAFGREKEAAFATEVEAVEYRNALRAARRAFRQGADAADQMAALELLTQAATEAFALMRPAIEATVRDLREELPKLRRAEG
jgi:hypothetical protein